MLVCLWELQRVCPTNTGKSFINTQIKVFVAQLHSCITSRNIRDRFLCKQLCWVILEASGGISRTNETNLLLTKRFSYQGWVIDVQM